MVSFSVCWWVSKAHPFSDPPSSSSRLLPSRKSWVCVPAVWQYNAQQNLISHKFYWLNEWRAWGEAALAGELKARERRDFKYTELHFTLKEIKIHKSTLHAHIYNSSFLWGDEFLSHQMNKVVCASSSVHSSMNVCTSFLNPPADAEAFISPSDLSAFEMSISTPAHPRHLHSTRAVEPPRILPFVWNSTSPLQPRNGLLSYLENFAEWKNTQPPHISNMDWYKKSGFFCPGNSE